MFYVEMDPQILLITCIGEEGFVGILDVENEIVQAAMSRTKALVITRNRNKALKFA